MLEETSSIILNIIVLSQIIYEGCTVSVNKTYFVKLKERVCQCSFFMATTWCQYEKRKYS